MSEEPSDYDQKQKRSVRAPIPSIVEFDSPPAPARNTMKSERREKQTIRDREYQVLSVGFTERYRREDKSSELNKSAMVFLLVAGLNSGTVEESIEFELFFSIEKEK